MTDDQKQQLKDKIKTDIETVAEDMAVRKSSTKAVKPDVAIGRLTRMEAINDKSINEATLRQLQNQMSSLQSALIRIDSDSYGLCIECEEEISIKRLQLLPGATKCIDCAK